MKRRSFHLSALAAFAAVLSPLPALAQRGGKTSVTLGMTLEPTGMDPTVAAASSIGEVTLYNVYETLTKIQPDGSVAPLLAERWEVAPDLRTHTFHLKPGVQFHNGEPLTAATVQFAFERAAHAKSTNKDKAVFTQMQRIQAVDAHTLVIVNREPDPNFLFCLGQATAVIVEPKSADTNASKPVGTGPYLLDNWARGSAVTLKAWPDHRDAARIGIRRAVFRVISDPAAQAAALLSGDVDAFPRLGERSVPQFKANPRFQVLVAGSRAKTILAINNAKAPLNDVRVRRAICAAIDRKAVIAAAAGGFGVPIGSFYVPGAPGYVDTTGINPFDLAKAQALMKQAGVTTPLTLTLTLPPPPYARQGAEVIISQLAKIGIQVKAQAVEWAQWLQGTLKDRHYDLSIISHVEPFDLGNFANPDYYFGYKSEAFNKAYQASRVATDATARHKALAEAQTILAQDAAAGFLYQPQWTTVANKQLKGLWTAMPIFANDLSAMSWA
ncbi:ABC transporter substrate-binding protein [Comamonas serinivorans]|uniref:ABC transporter substrate-binding protein n=1 Tax=Comamonas serinivorans TaxID=1082851 RepID=A0A1Y0EK89_9BURK|nr:ABC transporter substrate-binding protein [Comamonas serinivorans]ARU03986.1 ABC transporter substrate-binding protein [Comamonas serinivorans]